MTSNKKVLAFIEETKALCDPKEVVWVDGSEEQLEAFRKQAVEEGILIKLNQEKLPGCYLHRTTQNDVARVEGRTYICSKNKDARSSRRSASNLPTPSTSCSTWRS